MSLFGKFYERIHGSTEFLASESLNYILNSSQKADENLVKKINLDNGSNYDSISFLSQVQGENNEIPDLSGYDKNGKEVIILETKFWATLTDNQPGTYLKRLEENGVLVFICPDLRTQSLKGELYNALKNEGFEYTYNETKICIEKKSILIYSWKTILDTMEIDNTDFEVRSDINQLRGLCERIDNNSFLPITQKDLSPEIPRRILSYNLIVDKVIDKLVSEDSFSLEGVKKTPTQWGYKRYAHKNGLTVCLMVNLQMWSESADTPIWFEVSDNWNNDQTPVLTKINTEIEKKYNIKNAGKPFKRLCYPIRIKAGEIENNIIQSTSTFIKNIYKLYEKNI